MDTSFHYFVTSVGRWAVGTNRKELEQSFRRDGLEFNIWKVPGPLDAAYKIQRFCPMVEGAEFLKKVTP